MAESGEAEGCELSVGVPDEYVVETVALMEDDSDVINDGMTSILDAEVDKTLDPNEDTGSPPELLRLTEAVPRTVVADVPLRAKVDG